jgi:hypothetical protein
MNATEKILSISKNTTTPEEMKKNQAIDTSNVLRIKNMDSKGAARNDINKELNDKITIIANNQYLDTLADEALRALVNHNSPPVLYNRNGELIKVCNVQDKDCYNRVITRPVIKSISESSLRGYLARSAKYVKTRVANGKVRHIPTNPPIEVARDILVRDVWEGIPLLRGIVGAPIMRWDGSIYDKPGYDQITALYYSSSDSVGVLKIPDDPDTIDIITAKEILEDLLVDFPFDSEASQTNSIAAILTPVLRDQIEGPVPMLLLDKPSQGTGASLLADVISIISTGKPSYVTTEPEGRQKEEEWRKRITALLLDSRPVVVIDNVEGKLQSPNLCALLTTTQWSDRLLGRNGVINLQNRTFWIVTGNNIRLAGDLPRRCFKTRLDAQQARPWQRTTQHFKHPQLLHFVTNNRGRILTAIYTLARAWIQAGRPAPRQAPILGSFEKWREVIGGILEFADLSGFLENLNELYDDAEQNEGLEIFLEACYTKWGSCSMTVKQLVRSLECAPEVADLLPTWLDPKEKGFTRKLGNLFSKKAGFFFNNGLKLDRVGQANRALKWRITRADNLEKYDPS